MDDAQAPSKAAGASTAGMHAVNSLGGVGPTSGLVLLLLLLLLLLSWVCCTAGAVVVWCCIAQAPTEAAGSTTAGTHAVSSLCYIGWPAAAAQLPQAAGLLHGRCCCCFVLQCASPPCTAGPSTAGTHAVSRLEALACDLLMTQACCETGGVVVSCCDAQAPAQSRLEQLGELLLAHMQ